ncbi:MAG: glycosyltransferase family 2 protein [Selenomonadaceae bacterium]|nr:glycosyltransferase family 2 protein [Selenomonadaceae bacterium]
MTNTPPHLHYPAVSVIIAMYNTEKYIGECLDSILGQTFQNFEVIVVDDCSTDNSNAIVKSYAEKFGGRLKLFRLPKNSGNMGIPDNKGLALSRGEYVIFMDSDDAVTPDALEKLYTTAKKFDADVVGCEKYYDVPEQFWYDTEFRKQLKPSTYQTGVCVTEPTLITNDFAERVKECFQRRFLWNIWSKLIRRNFLIENEISMTNEMANDMLLTCFLVYSAKRYVRVPYTINFYRVLESSLTHQKRDPLKKFKKYVRALSVGIEHLDKFLDRQEFFQSNPTAKYMAFELYTQEILSYLNEIYLKIPTSDLDNILREELFLSDNLALSTFIFNTMNIYRLQLRQAQIQLNQIVTQANQQINQFNQFAAQAKQRIAELENEIKRLKNEE